jgi:hypothetical protein
MDMRFSRSQIVRIGVAIGLSVVAVARVATVELEELSVSLSCQQSEWLVAARSNRSVLDRILKAAYNEMSPGGLDYARRSCI